MQKDEDRYIRMLVAEPEIDFGARSQSLRFPASDEDGEGDSGPDEDSTRKPVQGQRWIDNAAIIFFIGPSLAMIPVLISRPAL
jgi:hypothetical protein